MMKKTPINCSKVLLGNITHYFTIAYRNSTKNWIEHLSGHFLWHEILLTSHGHWLKGGSLKATKLVQHIILTTSQVKPTKNNVYSEVPKLLNSLLEKNPESGLVIRHKPPPQYFKICSVVSVEADNIQLEMNKWPVAIMDDGCSTNVSADLGWLPLVSDMLLMLQMGHWKD